MKKMIKGSGIMIAAFLMSIMLLASCGKKNEETAEKASAEETQVNTDLEEAKRFAGEWRDEANNAILDIWVSSDAVCHGEIIVTNSENDLTFWYFTGTIVDEEIVYLDGERVDAHYDEAGNVEDTSIYTRGRGRIGFSGKNLFWNDSKEDAGEEMTFVYYGEY